MPDNTEATGGTSNQPEAPQSEQPAAIWPGMLQFAAGRGDALRVEPPVRWWEVVAILLMVVLADVTIYRAYGFAGYAVFFAAAPILLYVAAPRKNHGFGFWLLGLMLLVLVVKMLWMGSWLLAAAGFALLVAFAMVLAGMTPYVLDAFVFASQTVLASYVGLGTYRRYGDRVVLFRSRTAWLSVGLPVAAFLVFSLLFIVANPDLLTAFGERVYLILTTLRDWILYVAPSWPEVVFWLVVLWLVVGLLRPVVTRSLMEEAFIASTAPTADAPSVKAVLYAPFRNTLITVIVLFAVYLVFEFWTLWFCVFPEGFHYSGYAHEGAAWLTVALALATMILSLIFRGQVLEDARCPKLRRLAWIWSVENMLLAIAVYHRLSIYIGFNGMTRMRVVGIFGMSCVVAGFFLVVWKIAKSRDFVWLLRRHLWALAVTVYLFALTPVDTIVQRYNVRQILSGDPAPSVQISEHPISSEGVLELLPLLKCEDKIIREGVRAMLAERLDEAEELAKEHRKQGWTTYQIADRKVLEGLRANSDRWADYEDRQKRDAALKRFHDYAYQWW